MKVTYDADADAAYIYIADAIGAGGVAVTAPGDPGSDLTFGINLDFDSDGRLVGIEILDAEQRLPAGFLDRHAET